MRIIKKYSNRRLYDTSASAYVNLEDLAALVASGEQLQVLDAQSGEDLSKAVLMQILIEQEGGGQLFPVGLLHRMIRFCGHAPWQKALSGQVATGMELLDVQLNQLEAGCVGTRRPSARRLRQPHSRTRSAGGARTL